MLLVELVSWSVSQLIISSGQYAAMTHSTPACTISCNTDCR